MLTLEYKLDGTPAQYAAMDEGIRTVQFIRNTCLRAWMDRLPEGKTFEAMSMYTAVLAREFAFAGRLGSQARQASAGRAWAALSRFYDTSEPLSRLKPGGSGRDHRPLCAALATWTTLQRSQVQLATLLQATHSDSDRPLEADQRRQADACPSRVGWKWPARTPSAWWAPTPARLLEPDPP